MQTVALLHAECAISQTEKSRKISAPVQRQAIFNLNFEEKIGYACNLCALCDKGMAILHIKCGFFLAFKQVVWPFSGVFLALFGFLLKFSSSDNPGSATAVNATQLVCPTFVYRTTNAGEILWRIIMKHVSFILFFTRIVMNQ